MFSTIYLLLVHMMSVISVYIFYITCLGCMSAHVMAHLLYIQNCFLLSTSEKKQNVNISPEITDKGDLTSQIGTVDKFASITLNGPPPSAARNVKILKAAFKVMFKDNFAKHVTHSGNSNVTSKVVSRIINGTDQDSVLPCFY